MKSLWNPNRFLRSIALQHFGNPQPPKVYMKRMAARAFNSTWKKGRNVRQVKFYIPKSSAFWRHP